MRRILVMVAAVAVSGCAALGSMQTASTAGAGNFQGGAELSLYTFAYVGNTFGATNPGPAYLPNVNFAFRYGVTDYFDIGVRAGTTLIELQTKFMFTSPDSFFVASLAPAISGFFLGSGGSSAGLLNVAVPVLLGFKFGDHELVVGPRLANTVLFGNVSGTGGSSSAVYIMGLGGSVGFTARLADSFILMPEIAIQVPVFATASTTGLSSSSASNPGLIYFTFGVGAIFGKMKPRGGAHERPPPPPPDDGTPPPPPPPSDVPPPPPPPPPSST